MDKKPVLLTFYYAIAIQVLLESLILVGARPSWSVNPGARVEKNWFKVGQDELEEVLEAKINCGVARNVILFLGDGMGVPTVTAARVYQTQNRGLSGADTYLEWEKFPYSALSRTHSADRLTGDSASTGTAYLSGVKVRSKTVGVNQNVMFNNCTQLHGNEVDSIVKLSHLQGKRTGVVTTTRITHATPAASYAHSPSRYWEAFIDGDAIDAPSCRGLDLATQLVEQNNFINVIFGGGRESLIPENEKDPEDGTFGKRRDGKNLIRKWEEIMKNSSLSNDEFSFIKNKKELVKIDVKKIEKVLGLFRSDHMSYEADRQLTNNKHDEPSLTEMVEKAIKILENGKNGYFLLVEGGLIDQAHHESQAALALNETVALSDAVRRATQLVNEQDTLIIVTADHSHTMTIAGYPSLDNHILDLNHEAQSLDGKPFTVLNYVNGPGFANHRMKNGTETPRKNLTSAETMALRFRGDAVYPMEMETHGGEEVAVYARGPMSHLFRGAREQNFIAHAMMYASCVGHDRRHCSAPARGACAESTPISAACHTAHAPRLPIIVLLAVMLIAGSVV